MTRVGLLALAVGALMAGSPSVARTQEVAEPQVTLSHTSVAPGDELGVHGTGFAAGDLVNIEMCGNAALDATVDCDVRGATEFAVRSTGEVYGAITVRVPPQPCPCVIRVTGANAATEVRVSIDMPAAGFGPAEQRVPQPDMSRQLQITRFVVEGGGGLMGLIGAPVDRVVRLEITNTSAQPIADPALSLTFGRDRDPTEVIPTPKIAPVDPGEVITISVPFELEAMSFGRYTLRASIGGLGDPVVARASTSTYPWVLIGVGLVVAQLGLLRIRNRVRSRIASRHSGAGLSARDADDDPSPIPAAAASIDAAVVEPVGPDHEPDASNLVGVVPSLPIPPAEDVEKAVEALDELARRLRDESGVALLGHFEAAEAMTAVIRTTTADDAAAARAEADAGIDQLRHLLQAVRGDVETSLGDIDSRLAGLSDDADSAMAASVRRLDETRRRADELFSIVEREIAAVRADAEELHRVQRERLAVLRDDLGAMADTLEVRVADATQQTSHVLQRLLSRIEEHSRAALDRIEEREEQLRQQIVDASAAMVQDFAGQVVRSAFEGGASGAPDPASEPRVVDLTDRPTPPAAEGPDVAAPPRSRDPFTDAIHRAVRRSLSS